jgi:Domain of unknown function (DUF4340)
MNQKQLTLLIVLGLILGGLGLYVSRRHANAYSTSSEGVGKKLLPDLDPNQIARITFTDSTNELNLVVTNDIWTVQERYGYPANFGQIGTFVRKMWDLKPVQTEQVGPSQLPTLDLAEPGKGPHSATRVEFKDKAGKSLATVLLGKQHKRKSGQESDDEGWPDGRYLLVADGPKNVALVSDALSEVETKPDRWIKKDFIKIQKIKAVAITQPVATNSWKLTRESENGPMSLADPQDGEQLDTAKATSAGNVLSYGNFNDVASPDAKPEETGLDKPVVAKIDTFDGFHYTIDIGKTNSADAYYVKVNVTGDFSQERTPGKDEKPADKEKLDKEFKDNLAKLGDKLKQEKSFENWTYLVSKWSVDPLLKTRKELLLEKKPEPEKKEQPAATTTSSTPAAGTNHEAETFSAEELLKPASQ